MECTIITFGWSLTINPYKIFLQVIFAIGSSLIALGIMIRYLDRHRILYLALILIVLDNTITYFNFTKPDNQFLQILWAIFHEKTVFWINSIFIRTTYPLLSWIGVIAIGYFLGDIYYNNNLKQIRKLTKISYIFLFSGFIIRYFTDLCEKSKYIKYNDHLYNILSFLNFTKYPPSLVFLSTFCSIAILIFNMLFTFQIRSKLLEFLGRNSMKYYIIHIYIINIFYKILQHINLLRD
jgi:uncharacterized membrane protein